MCIISNFQICEIMVNQLLWQGNSSTWKPHPTSDLDRTRRCRWNPFSSSYTLQLQEQPKNLQIITAYRLHMDLAAWQVSTITCETFFSCHLTNTVQFMVPIIAIQRSDFRKKWHGIRKINCFHVIPMKVIRLNLSNSSGMTFQRVSGCQWSAASTLHGPRSTKSPLKRNWLSGEGRPHFQLWCFMAMPPPIGNNQNKT